MDKGRLKQLKGLMGKEVKGIGYPTSLTSDKPLKGDLGFDIIFTDDTRLEVYDFGKEGLGWCISSGGGK